MNKQLIFLFLLLGLGFLAFDSLAQGAVLSKPVSGQLPTAMKPASPGKSSASKEASGPSHNFVQKLVKAALARTKSAVTYDPAYVSIPYPMGDVPAHKGVCSDVVIRSYRTVGYDLQKLVHEDMRRAFRTYPKRWGLKRTDKNIDHRRVPNLRTFLKRHGQSLPISAKSNNYKPGDLVTWDLSGTKTSSLIHTKLPHIGIVTDQRSLDGARPLIVHNIGSGPKLEDMLFDYKITGHYRYLPGQ